MLIRIIEDRLNNTQVWQLSKDKTIENIWKCKDVEDILTPEQYGRYLNDIEFFDVDLILLETHCKIGDKKWIP